MDGGCYFTLHHWTDAAGDLRNSVEKWCFYLVQNLVWAFVFLNRKSFLKVTEVKKKKKVYRIDFPPPEISRLTAIRSILEIEFYILI